MTSPTVSVLMPVRNAAPWLPAALASLSRQTLVDLEVIAVDDGSTDESGRILDQWASSDPRIRVHHTAKQGLVPALNLGLAQCRAPLVARMDADDISHPLRLELQTALLDAEPDIGVASCLVRHFPAQRVAAGFQLYERWLNSLVDHASMTRERFVESPLAHPSAVARRDVLASIGGWRDTAWPEDYDLWLRLFERGVRFAKVRRYLFFWRDHSARLTRVDQRYSVPSFLECKARYLAAGPLGAASSVILWGAGRTGRRLSRLLHDEGVSLAAAVDIDPAKIGRSLHGAPVISPDELPNRLAPDSIVLAAVASRGARDLIRERLTVLDLVEGESFWCVS